MLRLTLAQMRRSAGRLTAAGVAIAIAAAFVAATLLSGEVLTRTTYDAAAAEYGDADLVVVDASLDSGRLAQVAGLPGVAGVLAMDTTGIQLDAGSRQLWMSARARATDPRLQPAEVLDGRLPEGVGEIALPAASADQLELGLGDSVRATSEFWPADADEPATDVRELVVVGLLDTPSAFLAEGGPALVAPELLGIWLTQAYGTEPVLTSQATVVTAPGVPVGQVREEISAVLDGTGRVLTRDERAAETAAELSGSTWVLTGVVLGFAAVALLVASLVIANTFQVLVAQRTRVLALLRCVGAQRRQLRRGVLLEAGLLGLGASAVGVAGGVALVQAVLAVLRRATDVPLPTTVTLGWAVLVVPLVVGTAVTLLASLTPARAATRVSPLAALRPEVLSVHDRVGKARAWSAGVLTVAGAALLALGWGVAAILDSMPMGLAVGMLGGAASFVGVLLGAAFWVPGLIARLGRLLGSGAAARLAAANAVRNPRRVATTSGALFIGVTLVAMMSTGAASVTRTFTHELDGVFPVDVMIEALPGMSSATPGGTSSPDGGLPRPLADQLAAVDGVARSTELTGAQLELSAGPTVLVPTVLGADPDGLRDVLADPSAADLLRDPVVLLDTWSASDLAVEVGDTVRLTGPGGDLDLTVAGTEALVPVVTATTLARLAPEAPVTTLWLRLDPQADPGAVVTDLQDLVSGQDDVAAQVLGVAVERAFFQRVIDTLLAVVVGLLGVAVVIAMVGVTNTLSLSVLERRRESATLRAIGMTRGQLRASLAIEGLLVALVGTVVGALLGVAYGFIGATILLSEVSTVLLAVPWRDLALVLLVAVAAALLASVLPARSATRTPPVHALAAE